MLTTPRTRDSLPDTRVISDIIELNDNDQQRLAALDVNNNDTMAITLKNYKNTPEKFEFIFDSIMKNSHTREVFHKYLVDVEKSGELIEFLDAVEEYRTEVLSIYSLPFVNKLAFLPLVDNIIADYIKQDGKKQVNLPSKLVHDLEARIEKTISISRESKTDTEQQRYELRCLQYDIFNDMEKSILYTIKSDSFRRCIRSSIWTKFVNKCCQNRESFSILETVIGRVGEKHARYTLADIKQPQIVPHDFTFVSEVCEDQPYWINVEHKGAERSGIEVYRSERQFIIPADNKTPTNKYQAQLDEGLKRLKNPRKFVFYLNHHYEHVAGTLLSQELRDVSKTFKYTPIAFTKATETHPASLSIVMGMTMPFPFSNREAPYLSSIRRQKIDGQDGCLMIIRPYNDSHVEKMDPSNERCRLMQCWSIVKIHETLTRVTMVLFMEFGGWLTSSKLQKALYKQQVNLISDYKKSLEETLGTLRSKGYPRSDDLQLIDCYEENNRVRGLHPSIYSNK